MLNKRWHAENPTMVKEKVRRRPSTYHGLTRKAVMERLVAQGGACAICRKPDLKGKDVHGDHDHVTGAFRGVLCRGCNTGIGMIGESPVKLRAAAAYIERHAELGELL